MPGIPIANALSLLAHRSGVPSQRFLSNLQPVGIGGIRPTFAEGGVNSISLKDKLRNSARRAGEQESRNYFTEGAEDERWGETIQVVDQTEDRGFKSPEDKPVVYINYDKFEKALPKERLKDGKLTSEQVEKYFLGETLHNLKDVEPETYERLMESALSNKAYREWVEDSYRTVTDATLRWPGLTREIEQRPIDDWHRQSRFDQIIGGYLVSGDEDFPSITQPGQKWERDRPGYQGEDFRRELENLRARLDFN